MKGSRITSGILLAATIVAAPVMFTGCAGDANRRSTGEYVDDKALSAKVKSAMFTDPQVSGFAVNVDTYDQVVLLSGFVDTQAQKDRAEQIAVGTEGVRSVRNNLVVKTGR